MSRLQHRSNRLNAFGVQPLLVIVEPLLQFRLVVGRPVCFIEQFDDIKYQNKPASINHPWSTPSSPSGNALAKLELKSASLEPAGDQLVEVLP